MPVCSDMKNVQRVQIFEFKTGNGFSYILTESITSLEGEIIFGIVI